MDNAYCQPKNIYWDGWKTTARLEPEFWVAAYDAAQHLGMARGELIAQINEAKPPDQSLASAIRVFVLTHYRGIAERRPRARGQRR